MPVSEQGCRGWPVSDLLLHRLPKRETCWQASCRGVKHMRLCCLEHAGGALLDTRCSWGSYALGLCACMEGWTMRKSILVCRRGAALRV